MRPGTGVANGTARLHWSPRHRNPAALKGGQGALARCPSATVTSVDTARVCFCRATRRQGLLNWTDSARAATPAVRPLWLRA